MARNGATVASLVSLAALSCCLPGDAVGGGGIGRSVAIQRAAASVAAGVFRSVAGFGVRPDLRAAAEQVADPRVMHFRDRDRRHSAWYGGARRLPALATIEKVGFRMKGVVWDTALLYPPVVSRGQPANLLPAPVVEYRADLAAALR